MEEKKSFPISQDSNNIFYPKSEYEVSRIVKNLYKNKIPVEIIGLGSKKYNLPVANAFHAGDGNLHPLIMYDANSEGELRKTEEFGAEILKYCVKVGGVLTGEHGVGVEKRELMCEMFNNNDIQQDRKSTRLNSSH